MKTHMFGTINEFKFNRIAKHPNAYFTAKELPKYHCVKLGAINYNDDLMLVWGHVLDGYFFTTIFGKHYRCLLSKDGEIYTPWHASRLSLDYDALYDELTNAIPKNALIPRMLDYRRTKIYQNKLKEICAWNKGQLAKDVGLNIELVFTTSKHQIIPTHVGASIKYGNYDIYFNSDGVVETEEIDIDRPEAPGYLHRLLLYPTYTSLPAQATQVFMVERDLHITCEYNPIVGMISAGMLIRFNETAINPKQSYVPVSND